jgi:transmembrane sensor
MVLKSEKNVAKDYPHNNEKMTDCKVHADTEQNNDPKQEALEWFVKLRRDDVSSADRKGHIKWLAQRQCNQQEYQKLDGLWQACDQLDVSRLKKQVNIEDVARIKDISRRRFMRNTLGFCVVGALTMMVGLDGLPDFMTADYYTKTGEVKEITLTDGSKMRLDADTAVTVDFSKGKRKINLKRGRAFFDVAKDNTRPFVVRSNGADVQALGTRFTVHQWQETVSVSVQESAVSVRNDVGNSVKLKAGERMNYTADNLGEILSGNMRQELAWSRGKLIFEDSPLDLVISDLNRYHHGTIRILDQELKEFRVSGVFDANNPDAAIDLIRQTLPVRVIMASRYLVLITSN